MGEYSDFFSRHRKALAEAGYTKSSKSNNKTNIKKNRKNYDYSAVQDSYEFDDDNYEHIAYGKSSDYFGKGDYEIRDHGLFGSTPLEDDEY